MDCNSRRTKRETIRELALPFFGICNLVCGCHREDCYQIFKETTNFAEIIGYKLFDCVDCITKDEYNSVVATFEAMKDTFEGERFGVGYDLADTIEYMIEQCSEAVEIKLNKINLC